MGYLICQDCGAHLNDRDVDLMMYSDDEWSWECPKCGAENYKESGKRTVVTNPDRIPKDIDLFDRMPL